MHRRDHLLHPRPAADPNAEVVDGRVRVTVLSDQLLRLEYAHDAQFEDRGSLAVVNRRFPVIDFTVSRPRPDELHIRTSELTLRITDTTRPFSRRTVHAVRGRGAKRSEWHFGQRDRLNLGGTTRTLDNCLGAQSRDLVDLDDNGDLVFSDWYDWDVEPGLLSRGGWVVVDDSATAVLDPALEPGDRTAAADGPIRDQINRGWPVERPDGRRSDLYLFGHGFDHRAALADSAMLFGPQPLPPRFAFGYWYSRYYAYTDRQLVELADRFEQMGVPLDVVVIDMDWHLPGWTGYTWDQRYFPDPGATLDDLHHRGLRVSLNLHPADGVGSHEDAFVQMCTDLGLDPTKVDRIPFDVADARFVEAYLRNLHHPEEDRGVDFWWMDWQQGSDSALEGLDPLAWLNEVHWDDQAARRPGRRPLSFSRWGGLGAGRYPVGFSGDTFSEWSSLAIQPGFTATSANVLYGYWSHDIGGHYGDSPSAELYTRWVQFGAHSPILRTHSTKHPAHERRFWEFPEPYRSAMIDSVRQRYELVPYLYGESRRGYETGVSAVRPMYHDNPGVDAAYEATGQYQLGDSMIVAPVVTPSEQDTMATAKVWLPRGDWFDVALGRRIKVRAAGGSWHEDRYLISETPVFVAGGSVIAGQRDARRLSSSTYENLVFTAYPGSGTGELYEDDGHSQGYLLGDSVTVGLTQTDQGRRRSVTLSPADGDYRGWRSQRDLVVRFVAEAPPAEVLLSTGSDGEPLSMHHVRTEAAAQMRGDSWWYDAASASVVVHLRQVDLRHPTRLELHRDPDLPASVSRLLDGWAGIVRRLDLIGTRAAEASAGYQLHPEERLPIDLAQSAHRVQMEPTTMIEELRRTRRQLGHLATVLDEFAAAWESAVALIFPDQREISLELLAEAARIARTTVDQFG